MILLAMESGGLNQNGLFPLSTAVWFLACFTASMGQGQEEILHYKIQEESDVGAFVGNVARDSQIYSRFSQDEFQQLQYSISTQASKFIIDENTSTLRTGQVLDREKECEFKSPSDPCELEFDVGVYKWHQTTELYDLLMIVHVTVVLEDINDNSPEFPNELVYLNVPESVPVGHVLLTSGAIDTDTGPNNNIQDYRLLPEKGAFRLQVMTSVDGLSSDLGIVVQQLLDRELQSVYHLQVVASDGGFPQRTGSVNITINVQDVNDNAPAFSKDVFNITVREDADITVPVVKLSATDPDSEHNGALTYAFSSRTSQKIREQFAVDQSTGDIMLTKPLDFEKDRRWQFMVEVKDHGSPVQQAQAAVIVNVADVNDNAPQIGISLPPGGTNIAESIEVGSFIAHVSLSDADGGQNGEIVCSVANAHFRLEKFSDFSYIYKILLQKSLDFEVARQQHVNVSCSDRGSPAQHNSSSFTIHVRDENDNAPVFSKPEYHISVRENMSPGLYVFQVIAVDPDTENNGNISFSFLDNPESAFSIDPNSGILRAMKKFDRESKANYRLIVRAKDRGVPPLSSTAVVVVEVGDVNDSPTHFARPHFEFYVEEEQPKGTVVDTLLVVDQDDLASGQLQFSFLPEFMPPSQFHIDVYTGRITTTKSLDREDGDKVFDFKVFVVDAENVMFNDSATVTVTVTDINDHAPNITFPTKNNNTVRMPFTVPAGTIVAKVMAHDEDRGENGSSGMTYSLESGDVKDIFLMNGISGELILTRRLDVNDVGTYHLRVSVQDSGHVVQMTSIANLDIVITLSNASGLFASGGKADHNVAIVVTLVCVTVALALAVMATICIIRRIDRERKHHNSTKAEEQNIYKQETVPPPSLEKSPAMENYENEMEKLKWKIKREMSFVSDDDMQDSSSISKGTTSFSTFKKSSSPGSTMDRKALSSPQASRCILHNALSQEGSTDVKRVRYVDLTRDIPRESSRHPRSTSPATSSQQQQQHSRPVTSGLTVGREGEDASSHTSGSTSDSGRGGSSEDDVHGHAGVYPLGGDTGGYLCSSSLSTFRSPNGSRPERSILSNISSNQQQASENSPDSVGLNSTLAASSPRSYLHAQGGGGSNSFSRNISFSDDSVTANTTVDRHNLSVQQQKPLPAPQQEQQRGQGGGCAPRGILSKDSQLRYNAQSAMSKALPFRRQMQQQQQRTSSFPQSPDVSPLENRSGDDIYGVRGKVVNFSVQDSYQMTPRGSPEAFTQPHQSSGVREQHGSHHGAVKGHNRTAESSLGQSYSLGDVHDALGQNTARSVDDEDRNTTTTTTTSGSYTINADDLCNEIDNLFFNDVVV